MAKRKAQIVIMDGYIKWARFRKSDMDTKFVPDGQFNAEFYPETEDELEKLLVEAEQRKKSIVLKEAYDGVGYGIGKYVKVQRNNINRSVEEFGGPPQIVKMDGDNPSGDWDFDEDGLIGNGSKVRVKLVFYGEGNLAGHRLEKVGILEPVYYDPDQPAEASGF